MAYVRTERSRCRKQIIKLGCVPFVQSGVWDGRTLQWPNQASEPHAGLYEISRLSTGMQIQFAKMIDEGYFGEFDTIRRKGMYSIDTLRHDKWRAHLSLQALRSVRYVIG